MDAKTDIAKPGKPRVAMHKFSSCDGCQLAFLNMGEDLLTLAERVDLVYFAEAGTLDESGGFDISFVEGSVATPEDVERIQRIRSNSRILVATGSCATAGGIQALRNGADSAQWIAQLYAHPEAISASANSTPMADHVRVDFELWGCPVNSRQILAVVNALALGAAPRDSTEKVCVECKRRGYTCVLVSRGIPCMGPVTRTGCGALCPSLGRDCYGCYGPAENANTDALSARFADLGLGPTALVQRFQSINSQAPAFLAAAEKVKRDG